MGNEAIDWASQTDVGVRRSHNQDNLASLLAPDPEGWRERGHIFLVADGMGAHAVGEMASELAVGIIPHTYHKHSQQGAAVALRKAFVEANSSIHNRGQQNPEFAGMGTTTTALVLRPEGAWVGHVGDSRTYRVRGGKIEQLTFDHSLLWEVARQRCVDPDSIHDIPSNVIVRSLGPEPLVQVDVEGPHTVEPGDIFLLCSDGLSGQVTDSELGAVAGVLPPDEACRFLVDLANLRGGPDNITVMIVRVPAGPAGPEAAPAKARARVPWPYLSLLGGVLLAAASAFLAYLRLSPFDVLAFLGAAGAIGAGLVGLILNYSQEQRRTVAAALEPAARPPRVHRYTSCRIERGLVEKLARAVNTLRQRAQDRQWGADLVTHEVHLRKAQGHLAENQLDDAFREYCRAMRPLTAVLSRQRQKEEVFQPVWDKNA